MTKTVTPAAPPLVVCFGELLWDFLPVGRFLGGAPCNVAYHLGQLGLRPYIVSAVGADALGDEVLDQFRRWGLPVEGVARIAGESTGTVQATVSPAGEVTYRIGLSVAWDQIPFDDAAASAARQAGAVVFGSLAQRSSTNRISLERLLAALPASAERVFDVNLRAPHDDLVLVQALARHATLLKVNTAEAARLVGAQENPGAEEEHARGLVQRLGCASVCITAGDRGAGCLLENRWYWETGRKVALADPVGAGDAFLAAFLSARLRGKNPGECLIEACRLGEWVASQPGATPTHRAAGKI